MGLCCCCEIWLCIPGRALEVGFLFRVEEDFVASEVADGLADGGVSNEALHSCGACWSHAVVCSRVSASLTMEGSRGWVGLISVITGSCEALLTRKASTVVTRAK